MDKALTDEQKAHDLAIAYVTYKFTISGEKEAAESFYQEYEDLYPDFLKFVKHYK